MGRRRRTILTITVAAALGGAAPAAAPSLAQAQGQRPAPAPTDAPPTQPNPSAQPSPPEQPAPSAAGAPATRPAVARADVEGDLAALRATLTHPDVRQADRDQAAARLVSRDRPETDDILRAVLDDGVRDSRLAVARALADDLTPSEAMVAPLAGLMRAGVEQRSLALVDAAAQALASYRGTPAAADELIRFATDPNQPLDARARAARALGRVVEPESAGALVRLVRERERTPLRTAAAEALAELSGIQQFGADAERWTAWLQNNAALMGQDRNAWRARMLDARAARLDRVRRRHELLVDTIDERMLAQYQAAPPGQRGGVLLSFLASEQPDERAIGAQLVTRAFRNGDPVNEAVRERLVAMVGDSDSGVRLAVAGTLTNLNHRAALSAELTQLAQERDERVRVALAEAVGRIEDPAAAPQLATLLATETSPRVIAAAAAALARTGRELARTEPALARRATDRLRDIAGSRNASADVRVAALDALGVLQDPELPALAQNLLAVNQPDPSVPVRQAALRALGSLNGPAASESAELITRALRNESREPSVRGAALDALARVGNLPEHGGLLLEYTQRQVELDENNRLKAWDSFRAILPRATPAQLNRERATLRGDPGRLAVVLEELCRQLEQSPRQDDKDDLANFRVELGEVYQRQDPPQPARAVASFRAALDYYFRSGKGESVTFPLIQQLMAAYLAAADYAQAVNFGEEMLNRDQRLQDLVGPAIRNEADRLRKNNENPRAAVLLIDEALRMKPPLDERFQRDLQQIRQEVAPAPPPPQQPPPQ